MREDEYVDAARALGASRWRILARHVIPGTFSYTIVAATLSIPSFILGESALSLLGLGIQEPSASWGNLLADAQNVQNLVKYPWILRPACSSSSPSWRSTSSAITCATASIRARGVAG